MLLLSALCAGHLTLHKQSQDTNLHRSTPLRQCPTRPTLSFLQTQAGCHGMRTDMPTYPCTALPR